MVRVKVAIEAEWDVVMIKAVELKWVVEIKWIVAMNLIS